MTKICATFLAAFLALAVCPTTARSAPRSEDTAHLPKKLSVFIGGPMSASYHVEFKDGRLRYVGRGADRSIAAESTIDPSPAQWAAFWAELERLGVWDWRPEYLNPHVVDGTWWGLEIRFGDRAVTSKGDNNYPQDGGSNDDPEPSPDFEAFLSAVGELIGGLFFR